MRKNLFILFSLLCITQVLSATCYKCEEIREKNKNLPPLEYEYYDDYLEAMRAEGKPLPSDLDIEDVKEDEEQP